MPRLLSGVKKDMMRQKEGSKMGDGLKQHREFESDVVVGGRGSCENGIVVNFDMAMTKEWYEGWYRWTIAVWTDLRLTDGGQRGWGCYCVASFPRDKHAQDTGG